MQSNRFSVSPLQIGGVVLLVGLLAAIRFCEGMLFYDPFIQFFKYKHTSLPQYDGFRLFTGLAFRYFLNSAVSLGVLWLVFKDRHVIKLSLVLFAVFFIVLCAVLLIVLQTAQPNLLLVFYIRRFLIQPLFLLLFLPAFYFQKYMK